MLAHVTDTGAPQRPSLRAAALAVAFCFAVLTGGCGVGGGTKTALPAAPPTSAPPGDTVLYVAQAQGNRVEAFRLGSDGLLPDAPFSSLVLDNPRRLAIGDGVLYVAAYDRVVALALGPDGALPAKPTSSTAVENGLQPLKMKLVDGILYVAAKGVSELRAYKLDGDGQLPVDPTSTATSSLASDFRTLDIADGYLYAASRNQGLIETFLLKPDGELPEGPEIQEPTTFTALPDDIAARDGVLYVTSGSGENLFAFKIRPNGLLYAEPDTETHREQFYTHIDIVGDLIYATAYNRGQIDVYPLDPVTGLLEDKGKPLASTQNDTAAFPAAMVIYARVLYVAQAGLGRVDAYVLGADGLPTRFPSSSTRAVDGHFPTDLVVAPLP